MILKGKVLYRCPMDSRGNRGHARLLNEGSLDKQKVKRNETPDKEARENECFHMHVSGKLPTSYRNQEPQ